MSCQEKFNLIAVSMKLINEYFLLWKMQLSVSVTRIMESLVKTNDLICLNYSSNCSRCSSIIIHTFFNLCYLGVKQRNLTKMGIIAEEKIQSIGFFFPQRISGKNLNSSFALFFLMKLFSLDVIRPEKCRLVRIMLELIPQRTVTDTDCPLWGRFVLVYQF